MAASAKAAPAKSDNAPSSSDDEKDPIIHVEEEKKGPKDATNLASLGGVAV